MSHPNPPRYRTTAVLSRYESLLDAFAHKDRLRSLASRAGTDFTSNDYLALAGGSRLLRGNTPEHERLEAEAAAFFRAERTLYFGSGYVANVAVLSTLPQREDLIVLDSLAHASANEGSRAGRA